MSWKCVICDTYNSDVDNECYVCGHVRGKEEIAAAFSAEEKITDLMSPSSDDSAELKASSPLDRSHKDPSGKDMLHVPEKHEEPSKAKKILIASIVLVLLIAALYDYINTDYYDSYSDDDDWGYEYSDTKGVECDDVTMYIPEEWDWHSFEEDSCEGVRGYLVQDDETVMWCQILSFGDFDSMTDFCDTLLQSLNMPTDGNPIEIDNCQEAIACFEYESDYGYSILAYVVMHDGRGYWVGVGALPDYYDYEYMQDILYNCTFGY